MQKRSFIGPFKKQKEDEKHELMKYAKDPKLLQELMQKREENKDDRDFQEMIRKYKHVAYSRKNMRVDMRPRVLAKTMTWELLLALLSFAAVCSMPFYFLKVRPTQLEGVQAKKAKRLDEFYENKTKEDEERLTYIK